MRGQPSNQIVAATVRRLRKQQHLSQEEFAARCGLHRTYVGAIERAEENITLKTLDKLARALRVRSFELLRSLTRPYGEILARHTP